MRSRPMWRTNRTRARWHNGWRWRKHYRGDGRNAFQLAQAAQAQSAKASPEDQRELYVLQARAVAIAPGQLALASEQAQLALAAWRSSPGTQARWHEVELDILIASVYTLT